MNSNHIQFGFKQDSMWAQAMSNVYYNNITTRFKHNSTQPQTTSNKDLNNVQ